jgi:branched-chain amino acid transport system substrate-binding protein
VSIVRTARSFAVGTGAVLVLGACGGSSNSSSSAAGCTGSGDVVIGVIAPSSGAVSQIVGSFRRGAEQAATDINAAGGVCGGRHIKVVAKDNTGDVSKDSQLAKELVEQEGAKGVVMISDDDFAVAGQYLQGKHVLTVGAFTGDALDDPTNAIDTFSVAIPNHLEGKVFTQYLFNTKHVTRPAVLYETVSAYGRAQSKIFCDAAQAAGTPCVAQETTTLDTTDVSAQVGDMLAKKADGILLEGFGIPVVKTIGTVRAAGFTGPILGTDTTATSSNLVSGFIPAPARAGFVFISYHSAVQGDPIAASKLASELKATAPITEPIFVPMFSYDAVQLMAKGFNDANSLNGDDAAAAIEKVNVKATGQGPFYLHDTVYSAQHHEPQVDGALTLCVADQLDDNGLAKSAG